VILLVKKCWYKNNLLHREAGLAVEYVDGYKCWYLEGKCHRVEGHTIEWTNGYKEWSYQDQRIECSSQQQFDKLIRLKIFL